MHVDARLRFDNYVVGAANRLAVSAARAVAAAPGTVYNPLFIYSGSGLGKTHLMSAIANDVKQRGLSGEIEYVTLDEFVDELNAAVSGNGMEWFKQRYEQVSLLLLDDVQFVTGRRETQGELLRLFNVLQAKGSQVVFASDRPPSDISDVDERLISRLAGGLTVDIGPPDYETRAAILGSKCRERGINFGLGVIDELARMEFRNVRELQGALNRLVAHQTLVGGTVEPTMVRQVLGSLVEAARASLPSPKTEELQSFVSEVTLAVTEHVRQWRARLSQAISSWQSEGIRTHTLEHMLEEATPPRSSDDLLREFEQAAQRLVVLRQAAARLDPASASNDVFTDPERVVEAEQLVERIRRAVAPPPGPSESYAREALEVGVSNQLAVRAADAVVAEPGYRYNPLYLYGPSGVGKTHLLHAIGLGLLDQTGGASRVACVPAQVFANELIGALQDGTVDRWRARYRGADALLLDDAQFVAGRERTQDELFHLFNAMQAEGKQMVLVADRAPHELVGLEDRLRSRFEGGLVVEMQSPDRALREQVYARLLAPVAPPAELIAFVAGRAVESMREIVGTANRLIAAAEAAGAPLTPELARSYLDAEPRRTARVTPPRRATADPSMLDPEKVVWELPDQWQRLIEVSA